MRKVGGGGARVGGWREGGGVAEREMSLTAVNHKIVHLFSTAFEQSDKTVRQSTKLSSGVAY